MKRLPVGIVSYGAYLPKEAILASEIEVGQNQVGSGIPQALRIKQKTVPAKDEDTTTLSVAAGEQALERLEVGKASSLLSRKNIGALFVGSESHPYAVKPTGTMVASALGLPTTLSMADLQFACKAGTQSLQIAYAYAKAGLTELGMAIGTDTAQARPGDVLEFTAGAGAAAFIVGSGTEASSEVLIEIEATISVASDTPDFWRRPGQSYPEHAGRFSGEPAYFSHISQAATLLMEKTKLAPTDLDYCVFHTPNGKFPRAVAKKLGFSPEQLAPSLIVDQIGNTYAASSLLALVALLDQVEANKRILLVSYGSGSGSDAFLLKTTPALVKQRKNWAGFLQESIKKLQPISYSQYLERGNH